MKIFKSGIVRFFVLTICCIALGCVYAYVMLNWNAVELNVSRKEKKLSDKADMENRVLEIVKAPALLRAMKKPRNRYKFIMEPLIPEFSRTNDHKGWTSIAMVKSGIVNTGRRAAIRKTWGETKELLNNKFVSIFILGRSTDAKMNEIVKEEHRAYGDILLVDMLDTTDHVPEKTLAGMQWVADNAPSDWIYSSADDDIALHVQNFARYIDRMKNEKEAKPKCITDLSTLPIMCVYSYDKKDPPARSPSSKWYMPISTYPEPYWPPYCRGGWYSMEVKLARRLYEISRWVPFLRLDDVWITGLMRLKLLAGNCKNDAILGSMLHAAPLSTRNDGELSKNAGENADIVIVSHAWGNIGGRNVDVPAALKDKWQSWNLTHNLVSML